MKIEKKVLANLDKVYSLTLIPGLAKDGKPAFVAGSETKGELLLFEPPMYKPQVIADAGRGGYISLWPLEKNGRQYVVASTKFWPGFNSAECEIMLYPLDRGKRPEAFKVLDLPYTHRIAVSRMDGRDFFLGSTLCDFKEHKDDWSHPGGIHLAEIPDNPEQPWKNKKIVGGMTHNHGMDYAEMDNGRKGFLLSADEGVFFLEIPASADAEWKCEKLINGPHSDAWAFDLNGSGMPDIFTIEPFHGNEVAMYRKGSTGWKKSVVCDDFEMGHTLWAGELMGEKVVITGHRRVGKETRIYRPVNGGESFEMEMFDSEIGAAQMIVMNQSGSEAEILISAHATDEVLLYTLSSR